MAAKKQYKGYLKYVLWLLLPLFAGALWRLVKKSFKGWTPRKTDTLKRQNITKKPGSDSAFYRIEQRLNALGPRRYPYETLSVWLNRLESTVGQTVSLDVPRKLMAFHYRYRFDPRGLSAAEKTHMKTMSSAWLVETEPKQMASKNVSEH